MARAFGEMGVRVALIDLDNVKAEANADGIRRAGGEAAAFQGDVLNATQLVEVRDAIGEKWGIPDILINGAGGNHPTGSTDLEFYTRGDADRPDVQSFFDLTEDGVRHVFD